MAAADRVAVETPRGDIRSGQVIDEELEATATGTELVLTVEIDDCRLRYPESDTATPYDHE